ncbi:hypothetical protein [Brevundimonas sp. NIBR11]|uniref:hypothetical protein n=1 Tax=Brevundimonas sp. NIBR11 TaxID=3015999 RepID=UPI0022F0E016|nr:hypothetical protein [Brevundimonas sp. NIBR11]WGM32229.1 hypothetical protein KKHFBJBL_02480 [Brevundimonas sp. NIBR11]
MTMFASLIGAALIQTVTPAPLPLQVEVPTIEGVTADPTCGGRPPLASRATCLATTQAGIESTVDVLTADFARQGWIAADGGDNRVIYVRRRAEGGCDGFQVMAFAGNDNISAPAAPAYLAMAAIPGNVCAAQAAPTTTPAAPQ